MGETKLKFSWVVVYSHTVVKFWTRYLTYLSEVNLNLVNPFCNLLSWESLSSILCLRGLSIVKYFKSRLFIQKVRPLWFHFLGFKNGYKFWSRGRLIFIWLSRRRCNQIRRFSVFKKRNSNQMFLCKKQFSTSWGIPANSFGSLLAQSI